MISKITKTEVLIFAGQLIAGIFSNPASGTLTHDPYGRQTIISQTIQDVINAFGASGIEIVDKD